MVCYGEVEGDAQGEVEGDAQAQVEQRRPSGMLLLRRPRRRTSVVRAGEACARKGKGHKWRRGMAMFKGSHNCEEDRGERGERECNGEGESGEEWRDDVATFGGSSHG